VIHSSFRIDSTNSSFRIDEVASGIQYPWQECQVLFGSFHSYWIPDVAAQIRDDGGLANPG